MLWHTSRSTTPVASSSPVITINAASNDNPAAVGGPTVQGPVSSTSPTVTISLNDSKNPGETHAINWKRGQPLPLFKPLTVKSDTQPETLLPAGAKAGGGAHVRDTSAEKTDPKDNNL
jgi:hypothetical protein